MGEPTTNRADAPLMVSVSGLRGVVGASLSPEVVCRFTAAFAGWAAERAGTDRPAIVLARDGRAGGDPFMRIAEGALRAAGARVIDLDVAMTASVGVMVRKHDAAGGLVLTASHNPAEWNGLKPITARGSAPSPDEAAQIITRFERAQAALAPVDALGERDGDDTAAHTHVASVLGAVDAVCPIGQIVEQQLIVALDSVNASGSLPGPMLLEALGCSVERVACDGTGVFPHMPEPIASHLTSLTGAVREVGADLGFAQDPDADRLAIVDGVGRYIGEEYTLALAAEAMLASDAVAGAGAVLVANLSTSRMIDDVAARHGARVVRSPVGEANVVAAMRREGAILGGEGNGGVIWPRVVEIRDSLSAAALVLALIATRRRPLHEIVDAMPRYEIVKRKTERGGIAVDDALAKVKAAFDGARADEQDGVRLDFDDPPAWLHVRPSNTEPVMRLIAEAPTADQAERLLDRAQGAISA